MGVCAAADILLGRAFEIDIARTRVPRLVPNAFQQRGVRDVLRLRYRELHSVFREYCARSDLPEPSHWTWGAYREMLQDCGLTEWEQSGELDRCFFATNVRKSEGHSTPVRHDRCLQRCELQELVVRLAMTRYGNPSPRQRCLHA